MSVTTNDERGAHLPRIVVGFDGSDDGIACVRWAAAQAALQDATLAIVHAYDYPYLERLDPGTRQLLHDEAQGILDAGVAVASDVAPGIKVQAELRIGSPAVELLSASDGAEMLVIGRRGKSRSRRWILGSVATKCVHGATCPVVAIGDSG